MAEWLYEQGIGEHRAALVDQGRIIEALIAREDSGPLAGAVIAARLTKITVPGKRGLLTLANGGEAWIEPLPPGVTEGATLNVEITREAIPESGRPKLPRAVQSDQPPRPAPTLRQRIAGGPVRILAAHEPDLLEQAGWSELIDEAISGEITFAGGALRISLTPAMTLIDVDGDLPPAQLARAGAAAAAVAIRRLDITGSIGIDLPTVAGKAERTAAAEAFDEMLPQPFERTAINGFGFMQVIRRRVRPSLPELLRSDPALSAALILLRRAQRTPGAGALTLTANPTVAGLLQNQANWIAELARHIGAPVSLHGDAGRSISAGDAKREHP